MNTVHTKKPLSILTIGTEILTKDLMDQYLRTLGDISTYYGSKMDFALKDYRKNPPNIIFCEKEFSDGSVQQFLKAIGGLSPTRDKYFVLAARDSSPKLQALADELSIDEILVKPFNADSILAVLERAVQKLEGPRPPWVLELHLATEAVRNKRFQEAERFYRQLEKRSGGEPEALLAVAKFHFEQANWQACKKILEQLSPELETNPRVLTLWGRVCAKENNWIEAANYWQRAQKLSPLNTERLRLLAEAHLALAHDVALQATRIDEFDADAHATILRIKAIRGQYAEALHHAEMRQGVLERHAARDFAAYVALVKQLGKLQ